jgi:hypothetical protein
MIEWVPQLLGGGIKEQFWKEKFHAVNGNAVEKVAFFFGEGAGGRGERDLFFSHFVPTVFSFCSHRVPK